MQELTQEELELTEGGVTISSALLNSFSSIIKILLEVGRSLGSSIRRIESDQVCPIK